MGPVETNRMRQRDTKPGEGWCRTTRRNALAAMLALSTGTPAIASVTTVFSDDFENGLEMGQISTKLDDSFSPSDLNWYSALSDGALGITNDSFAGGSSARALGFTTNDTNNFRRFGAKFSETTLGSLTGSTLTLSFDLRTTETVTNNALGLRFGLYNSAGTHLNGDNTNGNQQPNGALPSHDKQNDDFGYYALLSTGTGNSGTLTNTIAREPSGDNPLGGTTSGLTNGAGFASAASPIGIASLTKYSIVFVLTRQAGGAVQVSLTIDGTQRVSGIDPAASPFTTFDKVYFGNGATSTDFTIDNVQLVSAVPEPAMLSALVLGAGAMLRRRRSFGGNR